MYLDWNALRPQDLPAPLDDIAEHGGEELLDRLAELGVDLDDVDVRSLGMAVAWFLGDTLGGTVVYVSALSELERDARDRAIYDAHTDPKNPLGVGQLTRRFQVSRRTVQRALKRFEENAAPRPRRQKEPRAEAPAAAVRAPGLFDDQGT